LSLNHLKSSLYMFLHHLPCHTGGNWEEGPNCSGDNSPNIFFPQVVPKKKKISRILMEVLRRVNNLVNVNKYSRLKDLLVLCKVRNAEALDQTSLFWRLSVWRGKNQALRFKLLNLLKCYYKLPLLSLLRQENVACFCNSFCIFLRNSWNSKFRVKIKFRVLHDIGISLTKLKIFISGNRKWKHTDHFSQNI